MNIIICIKQVPDTTDVKIDPATGRLQREGIPCILNPDDKHAIEAALQLKGNGKATVITMGPPQAEDVLREALAMGCDEAILLCDFKFAGGDTWATANALCLAIKKIGRFDLILCGRQAIDGDTAQVGPQLAEALDIGQITYVQKIDVNKDNVKAERALEDGYEVVEAKLPVLLTCVKELNSPRYSTLLGIQKAFREKKIMCWKAEDIGADENTVGLKGSPTQVKKVFSPAAKGQGQIMEGPPKELASRIINVLKEKELVQEF